MYGSSVWVYAYICVMCPINYVVREPLQKKKVAVSYIITITKNCLVLFNMSIKLKNNI